MEKSIKEIEKGSGEHIIWLQIVEIRSQFESVPKIKKEYSKETVKIKEVYR